MKKYACNRLYKDSYHILSQSVITINERGEIEEYIPLVEETSATEWIGGVIILSDKNDLPPIRNFKAILDYLSSTNIPVHAWHITDFDFQKDELTPQSIIRRL